MIWRALIAALLTLGVILSAPHTRAQLGLPAGVAQTMKAPSGGGCGSGGWQLCAHTGAAGLASNTVTSPAINTTASNAIFITVTEGHASGGTLSDSKGNTWTQVKTSLINGGADTLMYVCYSPTVGTGHTFTFAGTNTYPTIVVEAWSGSAGSIDQSTGGAVSSSTTVQPALLTPTAINELILSGFAYSTPVPTIDSGFNLIDYQTPNSGFSYGGGMAYLVETTIVAKAPTWTSGDVAHALSAAEISSK
jgi:hypothetical protein